LLGAPLFDESGVFAFRKGRHDAYVQAGLICPDSYLWEMGSRPVSALLSALTKIGRNWQNRSWRGGGEPYPAL
jgi:hypothetical protein